MSRRDRGCGRAGPVVVDRGLVAKRRVATLTVVEHLDPFEHGVRELGPAVPGPAAVEQLGLHGCEERFRDSVVERVAHADGRFTGDALQILDVQPATTRRVEQRRQRLVEDLRRRQSARVQVRETARIKALWFGQHLYQPLLFLEAGVVDISPAPLNKGESRFVEDLKAFHDANPDYFADRELYLLRNLSKGRGVGFFEAGNFHPDFIVWQLAGDRQRIAFVDPKGIRNVGLQDPKIGFYEAVKEIERRLGEPDVELESFIVSNTPSHVMRKQWGIEKSEMMRRHIVFQDEDTDTYIEAVLLASARPGA